MKNLILTLFLIPSFACAQTFINQSKQYIINKNNDCHIQQSPEYMIMEDCVDNSVRAFYFDNQTGLCKMQAFDFAKEQLPLFLGKMTEAGCKSEPDEDLPCPLLSRQPGAPKQTRTCFVYSKGIYKWFVYPMSLYGENEKSSIVIVDNTYDLPKN